MTLRAKNFDEINMIESHGTEPLVSICIPVFNGEKTIQKTIDSILNQVYKNLEIFIVDNCSTDATVRIVQEFKDPRLRLIQNEIHLPHAEDNWNRCFQYVHGEFMAIFHADDVYRPQMVSRQIETFRQYPFVGGVFTQGDFINENDEIVGAFHLPRQISGNIPYSYPELLTTVLECPDLFPTPSAMMRSELYKNLAPFRYDQFFSASDYDMWLRAAKCAPIIILNEKLMNYRISKAQGTFILNQLRTHESDYFKVCDFHIAQNEISENPFKISLDTLDKYDLFRLSDQLFRARNYLNIRDRKGFDAHLKKMPWKRYSSIYLKNIQLLRPKYSILVYAQIYRLARSFLSYLGSSLINSSNTIRNKSILTRDQE